MTICSHESFVSASKRHYSLLFEELVACKITPNASIQNGGNITRYVTGSPDAFDNAILATGPENKNWHEYIIEQIRFFKSQNLPFSFHIEDYENLALKEALEKNGFSKSQTIQAVAFSIHNFVLSKPIAYPQGYTITRLEENDPNLLKVTQFIGENFETSPGTEKGYLKLYSRKSWSHYVARQEGKIVAVVSTMTQDKIVSIWNVFTSEEHRKKGLSTTLTGNALNEAKSKGCELAVTYLDENKNYLNILKSMQAEIEETHTLTIYDSPIAVT